MFFPNLKLGKDTDNQGKPQWESLLAQVKSINKALGGKVKPKKKAE